MRSQKKEDNIPTQSNSDIKIHLWSEKFGRTTAKKLDERMLDDEGLVCQELVKIRSNSRSAPPEMCWVKYDKSYVYKVIIDDVFERLGYNYWEEWEWLLQDIFYAWKGSKK